MYRPSAKNTWSGRIDSNDGTLGKRWHQKIKLIDLSNETLPDLPAGNKGIVILGFRSDEGVRRNKGRTGAKDGPEALRKASCNFADHFHEKTLFYDAGDVICTGNDLETAQQELQNLVSIVKSKGYFPIVFGGGHEVAYPHFMGLSQAIPKDQTIGIINFDAHFDLRLPEQGPSSGTPFHQIANHCQQTNSPFHYCCLGIQKSANTKALFDRATQLGVTYLQAQVLNHSFGIEEKKQIEAFIGQVDHLYLSICLDVFDHSCAPGVSATTAIGLLPGVAKEIIADIISSGKLIASDIAELNPSMDQGDMTAKLAAKLAFEIITDLQST